MTVTEPQVPDHDASLLVRIAAGDRDRAVGELYDRFATRIYGLGVHQLGNAVLAEELVQETFVAVWKAAPRYDPTRASAATFIFTIARRRAVDILRRRSARPSETYDATERAEPEDAIDRLLTGIAVREAIEELSRPHHEVIELAQSQQLTQAEIAGRLHIPVGTVKTRTYHALRALRAALHRRGIDA
jgi:RNA polymerase sigma-70 factor (ECF subfamily)